MREDRPVFDNGSADWNFGFAACWRRGLRGLFDSVRFQRKPRSLRVTDSLTLGEKRSLLVVAFETKRYLVATTPSSISLLDRLDGAESTDDPADSSARLDGTFAPYLRQ